VIARLLALLGLTPPQPAHTGLVGIIEAAASPTDTPTRCACCATDADPAIWGLDGWACVPCALADPLRAVTASLCPTALPRRVMHVCIGDHRLGAIQASGGLWFAGDGHLDGPAELLTTTASGTDAIRALIERAGR